MLSNHQQLSIIVIKTLGIRKTESLSYTRESSQACKQARMRTWIQVEITYVSFDLFHQARQTVQMMSLESGWTQSLPLAFYLVEADQKYHILAALVRRKPQDSRITELWAHVPHFFHWSLVALQRCVSFCCTAK